MQNHFSSLLRCPRACVQLIAMSALLASPIQATAQTQSGGNQTAANIIQVQAVDDQSASQRINLSGKLRMLSQRVVAAACYVNAGVAVDESRSVLDATVAEFDLIVAGLTMGNPELGIDAPEERRRTLAGLNKISEVWAPVATRAATISAGNGNADELGAMAQESAVVLDIAVRLVAQIAGQYSNPNAMRQADALAIDVAGRQRMLAQRISKNTCLVASGINSDAALAELSGATDTFDSSLKALSFGMAEVGIQPPPNEDIEAGLGQATARWEKLQPIVARLRAGEQLADGDLTAIFSGANTLTVEMNAVVGLYSDAASFGA